MLGGKGDLVMQLNVSLPTEIENALRRRAAAAGMDLETFVTNVVTEEVAEEPMPTPRASRSSAKYAERLKAWIDLHPVLDHVIDDSRESIYAGRGE
jgi:plasmid stability protein